MEAVLGLLGLEDKDVTNSDTLEGLGVDSMQLAEIPRAPAARALPPCAYRGGARACSGSVGFEHPQRALCRSVPSEKVRAPALAPLAVNACSTDSVARCPSSRWTPILAPLAVNACSARSAARCPSSRWTPFWLSLPRSGCI